MTTGDMDHPGDPERPGGVDEAIWSELVAAFHAPSAPDAERPWPEAENLAAAPPQDGQETAAPARPGPARAPSPADDGPDGPGPHDAAPDQRPFPGAAADPGADREGGPARVVRPAARPGTPPQRPPASVTWTGPALGEGPRDWPSPPDEDGDLDRFVPPPVPPMPELSGAAKAAWLAGIGGPLYLMAATILNWDTPRWAAALCVLGGVGGFAYLVSRLQSRGDDSDDDPDDPTYGAVV
jgi:hypothetical protein